MRESIVEAPRALVLVVGLLVAVAVGLVLLGGSERSQAAVNPPGCSDNSPAASIGVTPPGVRHEKDTMTYTVTYSVTQAGASCMITGIDATLFLPNGSEIETLDNATIKPGASITCPGGPGCVTAGPYEYVIAKEDITGTTAVCPPNPGDPPPKVVIAYTQMTGTAQTDPPDPATACAVRSTIVVQPDVSITKEAKDDKVKNGEDAIFNITVTAEGDSASPNVVLTDQLPKGATVSGDDAVDAGCDGTYAAAEKLECEFGPIPQGESRLVEVAIPTDHTNCPEITNTASVTSTFDDEHSEQNTDNNEDSDSITVNCNPDVSVTKEAKAEKIDARDAAVFNITVDSIGNAPADDVTLTDQLPKGGEVTGADAEDCEVQAPAGAGVAGLSNPKLVCDFGTLDEGASRSVTVTIPTDSDNCPSISNTASVSASNEGEGKDANNEDSDSIDVNCNPDVGITKVAKDEKIKNGDDAVFNITVSSKGDVAAEDVTLTDQLPKGGEVTGDDAEDCEILEPAPAGDLVNPKLVCEFGTLDVGDTRSVTVSIPTDHENCPSITNTASVSASNEGEGKDANNEDSDTIDVNCNPDVSVTKEAKAEKIDAGDDAVFNITVESVGNAPVDDVELSDQLPKGGQVTGDDAEDCEVLEPGAAGLAQPKLVCDFGTLDPGDTRTIEVTITTTTANCGELTNTASVSASNEGEGKDANNEDSDTIEVNCAGDQGCTPGYWKNNHAGWAGGGAKDQSPYEPGDNFESIFKDVTETSNSGAKLTIQTALELNGGGARALIRHAAAALLNASHAKVFYGIASPDDVIDAFNEAYNSGSRSVIEAQKNEFDELNNAGCSIDAHGQPIEPEE